MPRSIWKGHVSFGLVNIPVAVFAAERRTDLSFHMIDSRNSARVRYERVNEETGAEVPWDKIVKGYEYNDGNYVLFSESELERASVEMTRTIEIEQFVDVSEIDLRHFERPYFLVPQPGAEKGYVLLREAISKAGKAGIATVVIRAKQYLAALIAQKNALILELLRFQQELASPDEFDLPDINVKKYGVTPTEIDLATKLIDGMTVKWNAAKYHDEYRQVLMKLVKKKIARGQSKMIESDEEEEKHSRHKTINFMDVLKRSVEKIPAGSRNGKSARKSAAPRRARKARAS